MSKPGMSITPGLSVMLVCAALGLSLAYDWRRSLTWRIAITALAAGLVSFLGEVLLGSGDLTWAVLYLVAVPPAFTGGALLLGQTQLARVRTLEGQSALALKGFLVGCMLALPAALLNLLGNLQFQDTFIKSWWQPLHAIVPALAEETWARLFLVPFCYAMLRPATNQRPARAVAVAILISTVAWGFSHSGIDPFGLVIGSLLYGVPAALLLVKKDFEHAVGHHFLVDFLRYTAAFLDGSGF